MRGRVVAGTADEARRRRASEQLDALAWLMDNSLPIPFFGRIGLDALIGLVPGIGDIASGAVSVVLILRGIQLGLPRIVVVQMTLNAALDLVVGVIPVLGDIFDAWFKANTRNVALLRAHVADPAASTRGSWAAVATIAGAVIGVIVLLGVLVVWLLGEIIRAVGL